MDIRTPAERVAATIRAELARHRKTQAGLAQALGIQRSSMHRRMSGEQPFDVNELQIAADYLDVPVASLLGDGPTSAPAAA